MPIGELGMLSQQLVEVGYFLRQLPAQALFLQGVPDDHQHRLIVPRLFQVMIEPDFIDGADGVLLVRITGEQ